MIGNAVERMKEGFGTFFALGVCLLSLVVYFAYAKGAIGTASEKEGLAILAGSIFFIAFDVFGMWLGFVKQDEHFMVCAALGLAGPATVPLYLF